MGVTRSEADNGDMTEPALPTYDGVLAAAAAIAAVLPPTPAWRYPLMDELAGCSIVVKHENVQPTGAFKARGGLALLAAGFSEAPGLVTASTGNHAQSIAFAARRYGIPAVVVMPESSPRNKIAAVRALGAEVVLDGETMTDAGAIGRRLAALRGWSYIDPAERDIIHGHGTVALEVFQAFPDLEAYYVPIGSGTGAASACLVRDHLAPACRIIGVQSEAAPAAYESYRAGHLVTAPCTTAASGLATASGYELPQRILRERLDDFLLVTESELDAARILLATHAHTLAEGAGAAALAGLLADPHRPQRCAVIVTGGNADDRELASLQSA